MRRALAVLGLVVLLAGCGRAAATAIAAQISPAATVHPVQISPAGRTVADLQHQVDQDAAQLAADKAALSQAQQQAQQAWLDRLAYATLAAAVLAAAAAGVLAYLHGPSIMLALEVAGCLAVAGVALLEASHYLPVAGPWMLGAAVVVLGGRWLVGHIGGLHAYAGRERGRITRAIATDVSTVSSVMPRPLVPGFKP